jgi:hypothetical protein
VSSPYVVTAISTAAILALVAIVSTSNSVMNNSLLAQEAIQIQTQKSQENLKMIISNDVLQIKNNGLNTVVIKEIRVYSDVNATLLASKKKFPNLGLRLLPLGTINYESSDLS